MAVFANAQDPLLPAEVTKIYLYSGKKIEKVSLWKIDSNTVEYVKGGNLSDIKTTEVLRIESLNYRIEFDSNFKMIKRTYDLIVPFGNDTVRGIIKKISNGKISYIAAGRNPLPLATITYKTYIIRNTIPNDFTAEIDGENSLANTKSGKPKKVKTEEEIAASKRLNRNLVIAILATYALNIFLNNR